MPAKLRRKLGTGGALREDVQHLALCFLVLQTTKTMRTAFANTQTTATANVGEKATVFSTYLTMAVLAAGTDWLTKGIATFFLRDGRIVDMFPRVGFMLVYNRGALGGYATGPLTWSLNVLLTLIAIVVVTRIVTPLAAVDARATGALALVTGGALGNLASMLTGPEGVADFLSLQVSAVTTVVMNVADLMLWTGALMLIPVVIRLIGAVRAESRYSKPM